VVVRRRLRCRRRGRRLCAGRTAVAVCAGGRPATGETTAAPCGAALRSFYGMSHMPADDRQWRALRGISHPSVGVAASWWRGYDPGVAPWWRSGFFTPLRKARRHGGVHLPCGGGGRREERGRCLCGCVRRRRPRAASVAAADKLAGMPPPGAASVRRLGASTAARRRASAAGGQCSGSDVPRLGWPRWRVSACCGEHVQQLFFFSGRKPRRRRIVRRSPC
jgi:hypothetical protein